MTAQTGFPGHARAHVDSRWHPSQAEGQHTYREVAWAAPSGDSGPQYTGQRTRDPPSSSGRTPKRFLVLGSLGHALNRHSSHQIQDVDLHPEFPGLDSLYSGQETRTPQTIPVGRETPPWVVYIVRNQWPQVLPDQLKPQGSQVQVGSGRPAVQGNFPWAGPTRGPPS